MYSFWNHHVCCVWNIFIYDFTNYTVWRLWFQTVSQSFTPSSARAFCTILDVFRVMVREMTLRHFFPSLLPLFNTSSDAPPSSACSSSKRVISTLCSKQSDTGGCVQSRRPLNNQKEKSLSTEWNVSGEVVSLRHFLSLKQWRVNWNWTTAASASVCSGSLLYCLTALRTSCLPVAAVMGSLCNTSSDFRSPALKHSLVLPLPPVVPTAFTAISVRLL